RGVRDERAGSSRPAVSPEGRRRCRVAVWISERAVRRGPGRLAAGGRGAAQQRRRRREGAEEGGVHLEQPDGDGTERDHRRGPVMTNRYEQVAEAAGRLRGALVVGDEADVSTAVDELERLFDDWRYDGPEETWPRIHDLWEVLRDERSCRLASWQQ